MDRSLLSEQCDYIYTVGVSAAGIRRDVCNYIVREIKPKTVFDLGCGAGCYGRDLKERDPTIRMIGADGYLQYLTSAHCIRYYDILMMAKLKDFLYDGAVNVCADLVLFMDVLEHLERADGEKVLTEVERYPKAMLSTPLFDFKQGAVDGNELERHRTVWTEEELAERGWTLLFKERWKEEGDIGAFIFG
jgi:hypothetical protein